MAYQRQAWLELGGETTRLDDPDGGWICQELDLGFPDVRDVTTNYPDAHGIIDRSQFFGGRVVSAKVLAITGTVALDEVVAQFARYLDVEARPKLHFTTEGNQTERAFTLRVSNFSSPMTVPVDRPFQMTWVAPDPFAVSGVASKTVAFAGAAVAGGRGYPLGGPVDQPFERSYPGGTSVPTTGVILSHGNVPVHPYLRVYGPIQGPVVTLQATTGSVFSVPFKSTTRIDAGHFIGVDTQEHGAWLDDDPAQPMLSEIDWTYVLWPVCPIHPDQTLLTVSGAYATNVTQVEATWFDRYLT